MNKNNIMRIRSIEIKELEKLHESLKNQFPDLEKELAQLIKSEVEKLKVNPREPQ